MGPDIRTDGHADKQIGRGGPVDEVFAIIQSRRNERLQSNGNLARSRAFQKCLAEQDDKKVRQKRSEARPVDAAVSSESDGDGYSNSPPDGGRFWRRADTHFFFERRKQQQPHAHPGDDPSEDGFRNRKENLSSQRRADSAGDAERPCDPVPDQPLLLKGDPAGHGQPKNADPVCGDRHMGGQSHQNQNGDGEERSSADEGAIGSRNDAGGEKTGVLREAQV